MRNDADNHVGPAFLPVKTCWKAGPTTHGCRALAIILMFVVAAANADEINIDGKTLHRVQVVNYKDGELEIRTSSGEFDKLPLRDVEFMVLDSVSGVADFNEAEELVVQQEYTRAADRYERAVRAARGFWASMARVRLLMATDRADNLEKSVRAWLDVIDEDVATAAALLPTSHPADRDVANQRTIKRLEKAAESQDNNEAAKLIELLRYDVMRRASDPEAADAAIKIAAMTLPAEILTERTMAVKLTALREGISAGKTSATLTALDQMIIDAPKDYLPQVLLIKAQALLSAAKTDREFLAAALPAMRVVVHFPKSPLAGEGLLLAAEAHAASGRTSDAERLLRECLKRDTVPERIREQARAKLAAYNHDKS